MTWLWPGIPVKFSEDDTSIRMAPPALGEHTREILRDVLGYSESDVDAAVEGGWV